jgi:expansin (peptidoglycan-binding protein)
MKRFYVLSVLVVFLMMFVFGCGVRSTSLEGKVVDGKGQPLDNVKVVAKMSQPIKGYEQFETKTGSDGSFKFSKLFPSSEYQLILYSERWITAQAIKTKSGRKNETKILPEPLTIRFMDSKGGVVLDTKTNLMWASSDNGSTINWFDAKDYCGNYHGGGYTDWRMPTQDELAELHASGNYNYLITISSSWIWAAETRDSEAAYFHFNTGKRFWFRQSYRLGFRALPVRSDE